MDQSVWGFWMDVFSLAVAGAFATMMLALTVAGFVQIVRWLRAKS